MSDNYGRWQALVEAEALIPEDEWMIAGWNEEKAIVSKPNPDAGVLLEPPPLYKKADLQNAENRLKLCVMLRNSIRPLLADYAELLAAASEVVASVRDSTAVNHLSSVIARQALEDSK